MAKKKVKSRRGGFQVPLAVVAGFGPLVSDVVSGYRTGGLASASNDLLANLTGYNARDKKWEFGLLMKGMGPVVAGLLVHKLAGKLGVNRAISRAGIPWFRI